MKLASLKGGRDGRLVVVSSDLAWYAPADAIAPTLQAALDDWERCEPMLRALAETLEHGGVPRERFHEHEAASPLPRAYLWADGSACVSRSDGFLGPRDPIPHADQRCELDLEAKVAVVTGDVAQGADREAGLAAIRLVMLCNDVSLRNLVPGELAKPASAFSPVAVTPDSLQGWREGGLQGSLEVELNGRPLGQAGAGVDMTFDFGSLVAHAARTRDLAAGAIVGAGGASDRGRTPFLKAKDVVRIEMRDTRRHTIFGAIEQEVRGP